MASGARSALRTAGPHTAGGGGDIRGLPARGPRHAEVSARLLEAARELVRRSGGPSFTVTQLVAEAGTSLKSFYRCFGSKDDLVVALFAEDARLGARALAASVAAGATPFDRLREAVVGLFRFLAVEGQLPYAGALVREHLRLAEAHPDQLRGVLQPFVGIFEDALAEAQACGVVRAGDTGRDARTLFHVVLSHLHALICHQIDEPPTELAEELWAFCAAALRP